MATKYDYRDYNDFMKTIGCERDDGYEVTHDGFPLTEKESKFIANYLVTNDFKKSLEESGLTWKKVRSKAYITEEIKYRLEILKKQSIADADEVMQYFTSVMRGQVKDQFGLDAPLSERTNAAKELARRVVDTVDTGADVPEIKVTLNWE